MATESKLDKLINQYKEDLKDEMAREYHCEIIVEKDKQSIYIQGYHWGDELSYGNKEQFDKDVAKVSSLPHVVNKG